MRRVGWDAALALVLVAAGVGGCRRSVAIGGVAGAGGERAGTGGVVAGPLVDAGPEDDDEIVDGGPGNGDDGGVDGGSDLPPPTLVPRFVSETWPACPFSAPLAITSAGTPAILSVTADGVFHAMDPATGAPLWTLALSAPAGLSPHLVSPPAVVGHRLIYAWQNVAPDWTRADHHVGVIDLDARAFDPGFEPLTLTASRSAPGGGSVDFLPAYAYARAAVVTALPPGRELGLAYVGFGNVRDLQPWHGWLFEIDLDAWRAQGAAAAISGTLVSTATPNDQCGAVNGDGSRQMLCGGGIWAHLGPAVVGDSTEPDGFRLYVPLGNGLLDPLHAQYANSVLRLGRGLGADAGCDPMLCDGYDPNAPGDACAASCANLFIPRLPTGQTLPLGTNNVCAGRTLFQCYAALDWDLGASAPAFVALPGGPRVILQPGKDGALYLFDADHLGTLYDRAPIMHACGEGGGTCGADWAGTIVTRPLITSVGGATLALVPTFVFDDVHPAGLQAIEISTDGGQPHLVPRWQAPSFDSAESVTAFRRHASGVGAARFAGDLYAAVVDTASPGGAGRLYWVRVRDGAIVQRASLAGPGQRFAPPLVTGDAVYLSSCFHTAAPSFNEGPGQLEAFTISAAHE